MLTSMVVSCATFGRSVVDVEVSEGSWSVDPETLGDEELAFRIVNQGSEAHQPVVVRTSIPPAELPVEDGTVNLANIHIVWPGEGDFTEWPPADGVQDLFLVVEPGKSIADAPRMLGEGNAGLGAYVVFCYLPGHYERGEYATFALTGDKP